jgi:hypothetical protein
MGRYFSDLVRAAEATRPADIAAELSDPARCAVTAERDAWRDFVRQSTAAAYALQPDHSVRHLVRTLEPIHALADATSAIDNLKNAEKIALGLSSNLGGNLPDLTSTAAALSMIETQASSALADPHDLSVNPLTGNLPHLIAQFEQQVSASALIRRADLGHALGTGDWEKFQPTAVLRAADGIAEYQRLLDNLGMGDSIAWRALDSARGPIDAWLVDHEDEPDDDDDTVVDEESAAAEEHPNEIEESELIANDLFFATLQSEVRDLLCALPKRIGEMARRFTPWNAECHDDEHPWVSNGHSLLRILDHYGDAAIQLVPLYRWCSDTYTVVYVAPKGQTLRGCEHVSREDLLFAAENLYSLQSLLDELERQ